MEDAVGVLPGGEKLSLAFALSRAYLDPPMVLLLFFPAILALVSVDAYIIASPAWPLISGGSLSWAWLSSAVSDPVGFATDPKLAQIVLIAAGLVAPWLVAHLLWAHVYHGAWRVDAGKGTVDTLKFLVFHDKALEQYYARRSIPMATLADLYCDGKVSFNPKVAGGDCLVILRDHRHEFVNYNVPWSQILWLLQQFIPLQGGHGHGNSSVKDISSTTKEISEHYDRGNSFFHAFLGDAMVYTCGVFKSLPSFGEAVGYSRSAADGALEQAQFNKMNMICEKLQLSEGERFLDIGCGWGTLLRHAAREHGASATGVTLSAEGKRYCDAGNSAEGIDAEVLHCDYREIPEGAKFDKISSIEMAEHVGLSNFESVYLRKVHDMISDDGLFLLQVSGLRKGSNWEDMSWGLFMSRYIFPGADASTPLYWYVKQLEMAGFEVHSVETIGRHYSHTLHKWYDNWMANKDKILSGDIDAEREDLRGERLFRMWEFFLAFSVVTSGQGSCTCYQLLAHKNTYEFPRDRFCHPDHVSYGFRKGSFDYAGSNPPTFDAARDARGPAGASPRRKSVSPRRSASTPRSSSRSKATRRRSSRD